MSAYKKLKKKHIDFIKGLPTSKKISIKGKKILLCHGSPWNINEYIYPNRFNNFRKKFIKYKYDYIFLGHTHIPMVKKIGNKKILNPGSVGQPRDKNPNAKWLFIDINNKKYEFKKTNFNKKKIYKQIRLYDNNKIKLTKYFKK